MADKLPTKLEMPDFKNKVVGQLNKARNALNKINIEQDAKRDYAADVKPNMSLGEVLRIQRTRTSQNIADNIEKEFGALGAAFIGFARSEGHIIRKFKRRALVGILAAKDHIASNFQSSLSNMGAVGEFYAAKIRTKKDYYKDVGKEFERRTAKITKRRIEVGKDTREHVSQLVSVMRYQRDAPRKNFENIKLALNRIGEQFRINDTQYYYLRDLMDAQRKDTISIRNEVKNQFDLIRLAFSENNDKTNIEAFKMADDNIKQIGTRFDELRKIPEQITNIGQSVDELENRLSLTENRIDRFAQAMQNVGVKAKTQKELDEANAGFAKTYSDKDRTKGAIPTQLNSGFDPTTLGAGALAAWAARLIPFLLPALAAAGVAYKVGSDFAGAIKDAGKNTTKDLDQAAKDLAENKNVSESLVEINRAAQRPHHKTTKDSQIKAIENFKNSKGVEDPEIKEILSLYTQWLNAKNDEEKKPILERLCAIQESTGGANKIQKAISTVSGNKGIIQELDKYAAAKKKLNRIPPKAEAPAPPKVEEPKPEETAKRRGLMADPLAFGKRWFGGKKYKESSLTQVDVIQRYNIDKEKQRFLGYGQLPEGFEFAQGHKGTLGSPGAVAAAGAVPIGAGNVTGYGGISGFPGVSPEGGSTKSIPYGDYDPSSRIQGPQTPAQKRQTFWEGGSTEVGKSTVDMIPTGNIDRSSFAQQLQDPEVLRQFAGRMKSEVGSQGEQAQIAWAETVFNRASSRYNGDLLRAVKDPADTVGTNRAYYPTPNPGYSDNKAFHDIIKKVQQTGSNISLGATGNASGSVGVGRQTAQFGGERFGVEKADQKWQPNYVKSDQPNLPQLGMIKKSMLNEQSVVLGKNQWNQEIKKIEPSIQEQIQRPDVIGGKLTFGDRTYDYKSGAPGATGAAMKGGSVPFGTYGIQKGLHYGRNPRFQGNSFRVNDMFDPKWSRDRTAILFHSGRTNDLDRMYSAGCFAIPPSQWPAFKQQMLETMKQHGDLVVTVNPDGNAVIYPKSAVSTSEAFKSVTPQQFISKTSNENPDVLQGATQSQQQSIKQNNQFTPIEFDSVSKVNQPEEQNKEQQTKAVPVEKQQQEPPQAVPVQQQEMDSVSAPAAATAKPVETEKEVVPSTPPDASLPTEAPKELPEEMPAESTKSAETPKEAPAQPQQQSGTQQAVTKTAADQTNSQAAVPQFQNSPESAAPTPGSQGLGSFGRCWV